MRLADVLDEARRRTFVGRAAELARFCAAISGASSRRVFLVHGVGGIGKSTLLEEFRASARAAGRPVVLVDGREVDPAPEAVRDALGQVLDQEPLSDGPVLLVDHYENLTPVDPWLRGELLPRLPADAVLVLAGRDVPDPAWRRLPGWRDLGAVLPLDCLDEPDSREFLGRAGVPAALHDPLVQLSRGHPLALALLADLPADQEPPAELADAPDLVSALLEGVLSQTPGEAYALGLATCALAWCTTEDLLAITVGPQARDVWEWLVRQPYVARGPRGLVLHDLARDVLTVELERRSPERQRRLHRVVHDQVVAQIRATTGLDRQHTAQQLLFLHRRSPLTQSIWSLRRRGSAAVVPGQPRDHPEVLAIVERFLGPDEAEFARAWLQEAPQGLSVVRQAAGLTGFALALLCPTGSVLEQRDPVVRAALDHVRATAPLRPGERVHLTRFMGGADAFERDDYAVLVASIGALGVWLTEPLAWAFTAPTDAEFWAPFFDYLAFSRIGRVDVHDRTHSLHAMDWRRLPVDAWMDLMNERERTGETGPPPAALLRPAPLGREEFSLAVRTAMRDLHRDDRLATSPLLHSRAVGRAAPPAPALRDALVRAVVGIGRQPRGAGLARVLDRTFLRPAPTQEAAAEVLGLPFSTYRRHLATALEELAGLLWSVEIGTADLPDRAVPAPRASSD